MDAGEQATGRSRRAVLAAREVTLLTGVFLLYELGRNLVRDRAGVAFADAGDVLRLEAWLRLPSEADVQSLVLGLPALVRALDVYYVAVHFPATVAFLVWAWVRRPAAYGLVRSQLVGLTVVALILHVAFPLAPPRLMSGFVDTMAVYGPSAYGEGTASVANQFAAMPSLHIAWALVVGISLVRLLRGRWRWLALVHPLLTVLVVVATANHYWVDALAAAGLVGAALLVGARREPTGALPCLPQQRATCEDARQRRQPAA
jgi:PAP2 superfamily